MKLAELQRRLFAAARARPSSDRVPYAFEQRIMRRLQSVPPLDEWSLWGSALWRAAAPCVALMLLLGAWSYCTPAANAPAANLPQEFENTLLAATAQEITPDATW